jgi:hypothetical protein
MPKDQMAHLHAMTVELNDKLKVLVSEYKKDDNATATMLAFNRQAEAASNEGLKCGCPLVYLPRDPSVSSKRSGAEHAALRVVLPTLAGGPVVTAVQPAAVQPAAVQPAAVQPVQPAAADLQWVQCEDCEKWRKLVLGMPAWEGKFKCEMNEWIPESASCDAKEDRDEEVGDAVLPAVLPVVPNAIKNHQCYTCKRNFATSTDLSSHRTTRVCTRGLHTQRAGVMPRVYARVRVTPMRVMVVVSTSPCRNCWSSASL